MPTEAAPAETPAAPAAPAAVAPAPAAPAAVVPTPAVQPVAVELATTAAAIRKPGLVARVQAAMSDKGVLVQQNADLTRQIGEITGERDRLKSELIKITGERDEHAHTIAELERSVNGLNADKKTVEQSTVAAVASMGIPENKLPAANESTAGTDGAALYEQWKGLTGAAQTAFFRANEAALMAYSASQRRC